MKYILLLISFYSIMLQSDAQNKPRLVAISGNGNYYSYDTTYFTYSYNRGYDTVVDYNGYSYLQADSVVSYAVSGSDTSWSMRLNSYDTANRIIRFTEYKAYSRFGSPWPTLPWHVFQADSILYDNNGHAVRVYSFAPSAQGGIAIQSETSYTYNTKGLLVEIESMYLPDITHSGKYTYTYDQHNNLSQEIYHTWWNNKFNPLMKTEYAWSGQVPLSETRYDWDVTTNNWSPYYRAEHTSPSTARKLTYTYNWNDTTAAWDVIQIDSNILDVHNDIIATYQNRVHTGTGNWMGWTRVLQAYNTNHDMVSAREQYYDSTAAVFTDNQRDTMVYNTNGQILLYQRYNWDANSSSWVKFSPGWYEVRYYYVDGIPGGIADRRAAPVSSVYPNPAQAVLHLKMPSEDSREVQLSISSADGRLLRHWNTVNETGKEHHIPVSDLPAGNYLLHVRAGTLREVVKFSTIR